MEREAEMNGKDLTYNLDVQVIYDQPPSRYKPPSYERAR